MPHMRHLFSFLKPLYVAPSHKHAAPTLQKPRSGHMVDLLHVQTECQKPMYTLLGVAFGKLYSWLLLLGLQDLLFPCHQKKNQSMVQPRTGDLFGHIFKHRFPYISEKYPNLELWLYLSYFIFNHRISL